MSITRNLLATALMLGATGNALATSSVDLALKGSITPSACELSLANSGAFDLGKISAKDLLPEQPTDLTEQTTQMTVTCEAATLMAIESKDNRAGSASFDEGTTFGLGLINGTQKLGYFYTSVKGHMADGAMAYGIHSMDGGLTWANNGSFKPGSLSSIYKAAPIAPIPVQVLTANLTVWPVITAANDLTLTEEVPIDGSVTLTVRYL